MAVCQDCEQEMSTATGCTITRVTINGEPWARLREARRKPRGRRCHDCGILGGNYHHLGCDMERCPRCRGQLITCMCPPPPGGDPLNDTAVILPDLESQIAVEEQRPPSRR